MDYYYHYEDPFGILGPQFGEFLEEFGPLIIGVLLAVVLVALIWAVVVYVLTAAGLYTVAKRREIQNPWLAWIPVADSWILGCVSDQYQYVVKGKVTNRRKVLLGLSLASFAVSFLVNMVSTVAMAGNPEDILAASVGIRTVGSVLNWGATIAGLVFQHIALYDYYASANPDNKVLLLILGIFLGFLRPFFIFFNRKRDDGMPPRKPEPQQAAYDTVYETPAPAEPWDRPDSE